MSEKTTDSTIANEGAFLQALGLDPQRVEAGTTRIVFTGGHAVVTFSAVIPVSSMALGRAFLASAPLPEGESPEKTNEAEKAPPTEEEERRDE